MRTKKSIINTIVAFCSQFIIILLGFISRRVLIDSIGVQYLGINGLMTNILTIFSLAESGIGLAIGFSLYEPLAKDDTETVKSLMHFYKIIYRGLAILTAVIGIIFIPFLPYFLKESTVANPTLIYLLFLLSSVASYLWSYKITLNNSDQNNYMYTLANTITQIIVLIIKLFVLHYTKNYILYLLIDIGTTLLKNYIFSRILDKKYPYLRDKDIKKLDIKIKRKLFINIKSLFYNKLGNILTQCSDNLVISAFINITAVGLYSNYTTIITSVSGFITTFSKGVTASMGNLMASESKEVSYLIYKKIDFINYWLYTFSAVCLLCLVEPFVTIWLGKDYVLSFSILSLAVGTYYLKGINSGIDIVKSAAGLFVPDRFVPLIEAIANLIISIVLAYNYGISGVLCGTLISFLLFSFWTKPFFVFRDVFELSFIRYTLDEGKKIIIGILTAVITFYIQNLVHIQNIYINFLVKFFITIFLSNLLLIFFFFKTEEFQYLKSLFVTFLKN